MLILKFQYFKSFYLEKLHSLLIHLPMIFQQKCQFSVDFVTVVTNDQSQWCKSDGDHWRDEDLLSMCNNNGNTTFYMFT